MSRNRARQDKPDDTFSQFNFVVDLGDGRLGGFQEMSGLDAQDPAIDYRVSRNPVFSTMKMPGLAATGHVTLKRGVLAAGEGFAEWRDAVLGGRIAPGTIRIRLRDADRTPVMTWTLTGARPIGILGPDRAAKGGGEVAIETLEIVCERIASAEG